LDASGNEKVIEIYTSNFWRFFFCFPAYPELTLDTLPNLILAPEAKIVTGGLPCRLLIAERAEKLQ
jgi:hypothetical protein